MMLKNLKLEAGKGRQTIRVGDMVLHLIRIGQTSVKIGLDVPKDVAIEFGPEVEAVTESAEPAQDQSCCAQGHICANAQGT